MQIYDIRSGDGISSARVFYPTNIAQLSNFDPVDGSGGGGGRN